MKKKTFKKMTYLLVMIVMSIWMGTVAFADTTDATGTTEVVTVTGIEQTYASQDKVYLTWNSLGEGIHYAIGFSEDNVEWETLGYAENNKVYIDKLTAGKTYYIKLLGFYFDENEEVVPYGEKSDVYEVVTAPGKSYVFQQTAATADSATFKWQAVDGATNYEVYTYIDGKANLVANTTNTTVTINNLDKNKKTNIYLYAVRKSADFEAISTEYNIISSSELALIPSKITGLKLNKSYYEYYGEMKYSFNSDAAADGYEIVAYNAKGGKVAYKTTTTSRNVVLKLAANKFYKVRVRAYSTMNGVRQYGKWSSYAYCAKQPKITTKASQKKSLAKCVLKWKKCKGATSYTLYMSKSANGKFKKVYTTKKTSVAVGKIKKMKIKKNTKYYYYVVANRKVGKKTYKSSVKEYNYFKYVTYYR